MTRILLTVSALLNFIQLFLLFTVAQELRCIENQKEPEVREQIEPTITITPEEYTTRVEELCLEDVECVLLAEAIYHEARGESEIGQIAVGFVILNRMESPYFPDTITEVVGQSCQFLFSCDGSRKRGITNFTAFAQTLRIANGLLNDEYTDPTNGANHYLNPNAVRNMPVWANQYAQVAVIGRHTFHKRGE